MVKNQRMLTKLMPFFITSLILLEIDRSISATLPYAPLGLLQKSTLKQEIRELSLVIPEYAVVRLIGGSSYTGKLIELNPESIVIQMDEEIKIVRINSAREINFYGGTYLDDSRAIIPRRRGLSLVLQDLPIDSISFDPFTRATLNVSTVLTQAEFDRLISSPDITFVLRGIVFESPETMSIRFQ